MDDFKSNLIKTLLIGLIILFLGLIISFFFLRDQINRIPSLIGTTPTNEVSRLSQKWGSNEFILIQLVKYIYNFFTGQWDYSIYLVSEKPVNSVVLSSLTMSIEVTFLPLLLGLILGYYIGNIKNYNKGPKRFTQIFSAVFISVPLFFLAYIFKILFNGIIPVFGYKSESIGDPPTITYFRSIDCLLSGKFYLFSDYIIHLILPILILMIFIPIMMILMKNNLMNKFPNYSLLSNCVISAIFFSSIFVILTVTEIAFSLPGITSLILYSFLYADYFSKIGSIFTIIILFTISMSISNIFYAIKKNVNEEQSFNKNESPKNKNPSEKILADRSEFKDYLMKKIKSPLMILSLVILIFLIILGIFPNLFTPYSLDSLLYGMSPGMNNPPSSDHPLGQTSLGKDILALILWGIRDALLFGLGSLAFTLIATIVLIGISYGLKKLNEKLIEGIKGILIFFYVYPIFCIFISLHNIIIDNIFLSMGIIGIVLAPIIFVSILNTKFNRYDMIQKFLRYVPLIFGVSILFYEILGYIGLYFAINIQSIQLGEVFSWGLSSYLGAPWIIIWPGLAIFLTILPFFLLFEALRIPLELEPYQEKEIKVIDDEIFA